MTLASPHSWKKRESGGKSSICSPRKILFAGDSADSIFYLRTAAQNSPSYRRTARRHRRASLRREFIGEESLASVGAMHMATARP